MQRHKNPKPTHTFLRTKFQHMELQLKRQQRENGKNNTGQMKKAQGVKAQCRDPASQSSSLLYTSLLST